MSTLCGFDKCKNASRVLCYLCNESLCREHYEEHDHSLNILLKNLNDKIQDFDDRLDQLNNEELLEIYYDKIDKWRDESYKLIDNLYKKKCQEIKQRFQNNIYQRQEKINNLQSKISSLLNEEEISKKDFHLLKLDFENVENDINKLEQTTFHIDIKPLIIEKNLINIEEINTNQFNLNQISRPYHIIDCFNSSPKPLASNEEYLLIYQMKYLSLFNKQFNLIKQISWNYGRIWDICWSSTLQSFIIMAHYDVYLFNINTMNIQRIENIPKKNWWSCTCSNTSLYLSTYEYSSSILVFKLESSIELIKQWTYPITCNKNEQIKDINYKNETLALTIFNKKFFTKRFELRSIENLDHLWTFQFDYQGQCHNTLRTCSLNNNQWLIADFDNQILYQINNHGKLMNTFTYDDAPWYINLFYPDILVISTQNKIYFHKL